MKVVAIVQARLGSKRLPGKVVSDICGRPMIEILLRRLSRAKSVSEVVLATSNDPKNKPLIEIAERLGLAHEMGSEEDVLERFMAAAISRKAEVIVRITGDCPLVDPELVDYAVENFLREGVSYLTNVDPPTYPDGLDVEVISMQALTEAHHSARDVFDREHVTSYIRNSNRYSSQTIKNCEDLSNLRWTVDESVDLEVIRNVFAHFAPDIYFGWKEVLALNQIQPELFSINAGIYRNEGANMHTGQKLWKRALQVIPDGNHLLSKHPDMLLPNRWPTYFKKAKGCSIVDLDGQTYVDMGLMGVGTNILGYGNHEVDAAVKEAVADGNMSTLNCAEEVYLAERLVELHPWSDMACFARTGGEANSIAVRIARAASGKDKIAFCGYHGWHDWYLSANLNGADQLGGHLLPGLDPLGVPTELRDTVVPFTYNHFEELEEIVNHHEIGAVIMEVVRNHQPRNQFLQKVRKLTRDKKIVLIFDECTSGFRENFGGIHKTFNVDPDIAVFGKALGNGYAITSILGRREVMEVAQKSFISSTFWTERIGPVAALKTLEVMQKTKSWEMIAQMGKETRSRWDDLAKKYGLGISHWGLTAIPGFSFNSINAAAYKTLITQDMLDEGYLASNSVYCSIAHSNAVVERYFELLEPIFEKIRACEDGEDVEKFLKGEICRTGFARLN